MAGNGNLATQWVPGQSGNPGGAPRNMLTRDKVANIMSKFAHLTREELQKKIQHPDSTMLEITVAAIFARAAKDGDYQRLEFLLQRTVGKVREETEIKFKESDAIRELDSHPRESVIALLRSMHGPKPQGELPKV